VKQKNAGTDGEDLPDRHVVDRIVPVHEYHRVDRQKNDKDEVYEQQTEKEHPQSGPFQPQERFDERVLVLQNRQLRYAGSRDDDRCDNSHLHLVLGRDYAEVDGDLEGGR